MDRNFNEKSGEPGTNEGPFASNKKAFRLALNTWSATGLSFAIIDRPANYASLVQNEKARKMLASVLGALCWMRDAGITPLSVERIIENLPLARVMALADETQHPNMPDRIRHGVAGYLSSIPGFKANIPAEEQGPEVNAHHSKRVDCAEANIQIALLRRKSVVLCNAMEEWGVGELCSLFIDRPENRYSLARKERARILLAGVLRALFWMRDTSGALIDAGRIVESLSLDVIMDFADEAKYPTMPHKIREGIVRYLLSIPGFRADLSAWKQPQETRAYHIELAICAEVRVKFAAAFFAEETSSLKLMADEAALPNDDHNWLSF